LYNKKTVLIETIFQKNPVLKDGSIDVNFLNKAVKEELYEFLSNPQGLNDYSYVLNNLL